MDEIKIKSSLDGSQEKCLFYFPEGRRNVPLVTGLHSWGADRFNRAGHMLPLCEARRWALLLPEFRGPNRDSNPRCREACASRLARQDIVDAVNCVSGNYSIDRDSIFLAGGSGGGHMALMAGAYAPELWAAVSAWCPIVDLALWYRQSLDNEYSEYIAACCGGIPGSSPETDAEYSERSPLSHTDGLMKVKKLFLHHGAFDEVVLPVHSKLLAAVLELKQHPAFFHEIFDGGHQIDYDRIFALFDDLVNLASKSRTVITG